MEQIKDVTNDAYQIFQARIEFVFNSFEKL